MRRNWFSIKKTSFSKDFYTTGFETCTVVFVYMFVRVNASYDADEVYKQ